LRIIVDPSEELKGLPFPGTVLLNAEKKIGLEHSGRTEAIWDGSGDVFGTMLMVKGLTVFAAIREVRVVESEKTVSFRVLEHQPI
jgi:hypothetical protein